MASGHITALPACTQSPQTQKAGRASQHKGGVSRKQRTAPRLPCTAQLPPHCYWKQKPHLGTGQSPRPASKDAVAPWPCRGQAAEMLEPSFAPAGAQHGEVAQQSSGQGASLEVQAAGPLAMPKSLRECAKSWSLGRRPAEGSQSRAEPQTLPDPTGYTATASPGAHLRVIALPFTPPKRGSETRPLFAKRR